MSVRDLVGVRKGIYTLIKPIPKTSKGLFYCHKCHKEHVADIYSWGKYGRRKCGHEKIGHPLYHRYTKMIERCHNPNNQRYEYYGKRGIKVCERWKESFQNFLDDMEPTFQPGLELDRIDNDKGYYPENCRWTTHSENMLNRNGFKNSTGYPGIRKQNNRYFGRLQKNKKSYHTKTFDNPKDAYEELQKLKQSL